MENWLAGFAAVFALFLVMAAAVEMLLEVFRGVLERFGITGLKGGVALDDALKISADFVPPDSAAAVKIAALAGVARQSQKVSATRIADLERLKNQLVDAGGTLTGDLIEEVSQSVSAVRGELDTSERKRLFLLRLISVGVGIALARWTQFDALHLGAKSLENVGNLQFLEWFSGGPGWNGYIITGIAAASGSSYWHDQLDKVRSLKGAFAQATGRSSS